MIYQRSMLHARDPDQQRLILAANPSGLEDQNPGKGSGLAEDF